MSRMGGKCFAVGSDEIACLSVPARRVRRKQRKMSLFLRSVEHGNYKLYGMKLAFSFRPVVIHPLCSALRVVR